MPRDPPLYSNIDALNASIATKISIGELYTGEVEVGIYNGAKLYHKIFSSNAISVSNNVNTKMIEGLPALAKIVYINVSCHNRTNGIFENPDAYHRVYIYSDGALYFNQTVSSSACEYIIRADVYYMH